MAAVGSVELFPGSAREDALTVAKDQALDACLAIGRVLRSGRRGGPRQMIDLLRACKTLAEKTDGAERPGP